MEPSMATPDADLDVLACSETQISNNMEYTHGEVRASYDTPYCPVTIAEKYVLAHNTTARSNA